MPAFQAGTDRMFAQVQESFEIGMDGLIEQGKIAHQISSSSNMDLRTQVNALRTAIINMDTKIVELSKRLSNDNTNTVVKVKDDPMTLLSEGKIADAIECALEDKSIDMLLKVLSKLDPIQVNQDCSGLLRLCTTQQLAADLAKSEPTEGINTRLDWLKSLLLSLIDSDDSIVKEYLPTMLSGVYNNLKVASDRGAHVDLMMLTTIIKSRI